MAGEAVLGHSTSGAGVSSLSRDGGELDRSGPSQGTSHAHGPAASRGGGSGGVPEGARDGGAVRPAERERDRDGGGGGGRRGVSRGAVADAGAGRPRYRRGGDDERGGRAARDRARAADGDPARLQLAGSQRAAGARAAARAGPQARRRRDRGDGRGAGRRGGESAEAGREDDREQGGRHLGGGGGVAAGVAASQGRLKREAGFCARGRARDT